MGRDGPQVVLNRPAHRAHSCARLVIEHDIAGPVPDLSLESLLRAQTLALLLRRDPSTVPVYLDVAGNLDDRLSGNGDSTDKSYPVLICFRLSQRVKLDAAVCRDLDGPRLIPRPGDKDTLCIAA
jgi:hypothetical protein